MKRIFLMLPLIALMACDRTPQTTEECIDYIYANARVSESLTYSNFDEFGKPQKVEETIVFEIKKDKKTWIRIDQETALQLSKNWDFKDMKYYDRLGGEIQEHQRDACEVVGRMKEFINK